jgi:hypothetical protein
MEWEIIQGKYNYERWKKDWEITMHTSVLDYDNI